MFDDFPMLIPIYIICGFFCLVLLLTNFNEGLNAYKAVQATGKTPITMNDVRYEIQKEQYYKNLELKLRAQDLKKGTGGCTQCH